MKTAIAASAAVPTMLVPGRATAYNVDEIEKKLQMAKGISGVSKHDLPTPSLILDLDSLEGNISRMAKHAKAAKVSMRPHGKTHKTPEIGRRQVEAGALGICAATIREAEVFAAAGLPGILITSEMVGPNKIARVVRLTKQHPDTMTVVDNAAHVEQLSEAAQAAKVTLNVMIDIDPMGRRTGLPAGPKAVELAMKVDQAAGLKLRGVHGYSGASSHVVGFAERDKHSHEVMGPVIDSFRKMQQKGMPAEIMSGASTGTYNIDSGMDGMTELQVGSYVFMDVDYRRIGGKGGDAIYEDFAPALSVLATVISKGYDDIATIDAGLKAFATDRAFGPEPKNLPGVGYAYFGDEHGKLILEKAEKPVKLGDKVELIIPHCDPNAN